MTLQLWLLLAAGLWSVGLYGALSQQSIVMVMMGLELMVNGIIVAGAALWFYLEPVRADGQMLVIVAILVMTIELATGLAAATAIYRARRVDMTDDATDLAG